MTTVKYFVNANWDTGNDKCQNQTDREVGYEELNSRIKEFEKAGNHGSMHVRSEKQIYHVSSNGYYGYLPIMNEPTEELEMDTNDDTVIMRNEIGTGVNSASPTDDKSKSGLSFGISLGRRKRMNVENNSLDFSKKQRIEEFCGLSPCQVTVPPTPRSSDVHYPRCIMEQETVNEKVSESSFHNNEGNNEDLLESLLKHTHGCDLYHFVSYDL